MAVLLAAMLFWSAAPAGAEGDFSGCESVPILGLSPKIRKICDDPIRPDGSWARYRQFVAPASTRSTCGGRGYQGGGCPPGVPHDYWPPYIGAVETYYLTVDTVPPGEPGHLDNPVRCQGQAMRCEVP